MKLRSGTGFENYVVSSGCSDNAQKVENDKPDAHDRRSRNSTLHWFELSLFEPTTGYFIVLRIVHKLQGIKIQKVNENMRKIERATP